MVELVKHRIVAEYLVRGRVWSRVVRALIYKDEYCTAE
jgi:hypothetical protein